MEIITKIKIASAEDRSVNQPGGTGTIPETLDSPKGQKGDSGLLVIIPGFFFGLFHGLLEVIQAPLRIGFLAVSVLSLFLFWGAGYPARFALNVMRLRFMNRFVNFVLSMAILWLSRKTFRFFCQGFRGVLWIPTLMFLLPTLLLLAQFYPPVQVATSHFISTYSLTLPNILMTLSVPPSLWIFGRAVYFAIPLKSRMGSLGSSSFALRAGESWITSDDKASPELNDRFEQASAAALTSLGYKCRVNGTQMAKEVLGHKGGGDGGVDVFAFNGKETAVVSCKRYSNPVGVKEVREIFGSAGATRYRRGRVADIFGEPLVHNREGSSKAILVTTVGVTKDAAGFAKENDIRIYLLLDSNRLQQF